ncbi:hypothetical protein [uncultured Variovorax sp.]|uniref:hypothetical protein n=1 Tax=uncultured Variovorax sp. TaxID=114708 RepID=UPI0025FB02B7|nr:hypothetical protein [uncultured Variovorax sp.]
MSRWFAATVLAIMLSCYGFAVLAHNMLGAGHSHSEPQTAQATQTLAVDVALADLSSSALDLSGAAEAQKLAGDADQASDDALSLDEAGSEHAELVDARNGAPALLRFTEQPPKLGLTTIVAPFLARPKRPPRAAIVA